MRIRVRVRVRVRVGVRVRVRLRVRVRVQSSEFAVGLGLGIGLGLGFRVRVRVRVRVPSRGEDVERRLDADVVRVRVRVRIRARARVSVSVALVPSCPFPRAGSCVRKARQAWARLGCHGTRYVPNAQGRYAYPVRTVHGALGASRPVRSVRTQRELVRVARYVPYGGPGAYVSAYVPAAHWRCRVPPTACAENSAK